jgi:hypothetical protein
MLKLSVVSRVVALRLLWCRRRRRRRRLRRRCCVVSVKCRYNLELHWAATRVEYDEFVTTWLSFMRIIRLKTEEVGGSEQWPSALVPTFA